MSITLAGLIGWAVVAVAGYFVVKFTFKFIMDKIDEYFTEKEIDSVMISEIPKMMEECKNKRSYETLKKAWEKGYTHLTAKVADGQIKDGVEIYKDSSETPDEKVEDLLGEERMVLVDR